MCVCVCVCVFARVVEEARNLAKPLPLWGHLGEKPAGGEASKGPSLARGEWGLLRLLLGVLDSEASPASSSGESRSAARLGSDLCRTRTQAVTHRLPVRELWGTEEGESGRCASNGAGVVEGD